MARDAKSVLEAFNADLDRAFDGAFEAAGLGRQREIYDQFWRRYHAPRPGNVRVREFRVPTSDGTSIAARLYWRGPGQAHDCGSLCLYFHGGGWAFGSIDSHDLVTARLAERTGIAILSIDYRLAPEHKFPVPLRDCWDALGWVQREKGSLFKGAQRIGAAGDSAGAALAAGLTLLARKEGGPIVHHQALIYPGLRASRSAVSSVRSPGLDQSSMEFYLRLYLADEAQAKDPYAMPLEADDFRDLPPALIMVASEDVLRSDGETYAARLAEVGVEADLLVAEGLPHTFLRIIHLDPQASGAFAEFCRRMALAYGEEYRSEELQETM